ncbi:MAG: ribulose-phosphate 3-epimerase [Rickettsiales bacterium]|jgi:ribulose-phosphate 3-epimerase|nr:ribulose-phosphate 3-epimerase [Rickettsiales bacterium]
MLIYPSLLDINQENLESELLALQNADADGLHYDVMDGIFVDNTAGSPQLLDEVKKYSNLPINIHLMVQDTEKYIDMYLPFQPQGLSFHVEATKNPIPLLNKIKKNKIKAGLALDLPTDVQTIIPYLGELDFVLIMTVKAGLGGQKFNEEGLHKAREIRNIYPYLPIHIDGGITVETAKLCQGIAQVLDTGSTIYKSNNYAKTIKELKEE